MGFKKSEYTFMQRNFVDNYCNPKSKTYGKITKSYIKAGYKESRASPASASKLLTQPNIVEMISKYAPDKPERCIQKQDISKNYALACLQNTYEQAKEKKDTTNQVACVRLMMQYNGLLAERLVVSQADSLELDASYHRQYKQIASILIQNKRLGEPPPPEVITDVVFEAPQDVVVDEPETEKEDALEAVSIGDDSVCEINTR